MQNQIHGLALLNMSHAEQVLFLTPGFSGIFSSARAGTPLGAVLHLPLFSTILYLQLHQSENLRGWLKCIEITFITSTWDNIIGMSVYCTTEPIVYWTTIKVTYFLPQQSYILSVRVHLHSTFLFSGSTDQQQKFGQQRSGQAEKATAVGNWQKSFWFYLLFHKIKMQQNHILKPRICKDNSVLKGNQTSQSSLPSLIYSSLGVKKQL